MHHSSYQTNSVSRNTAHVDTAGRDAMLNEGGRSDDQRTALLPDELTATHATGSARSGYGLLDSKASTLQPAGPIIYLKSPLSFVRQLAVTVMAGLRKRTGGRNMKRKETHMNRGAGRHWFYWPAIVTTTTLAVGTVIYIISGSWMGANISLMFQQLI
jgi:hypothetical protein